MRRALGPLPEPFPAPFRAMLDQVLRRSGRIQGARRETARSRHKALVQSGTFVGHRPYASGDDLRRIDWNAYARTGHLYVKLLAEDERRATTLWLDTSPSMRAGEPPRLCTALRVAAILGGLALVHLDGVLVHAGGSVTFSGRGAVAALLEHLRQLPLLTYDPTVAAAQLARQQAPGKVHWISDFADPSATERTLLRLRRSGFEVVGWLPAIADDVAVPSAGWTMVLDPETGEEMPLRIDAELAEAMAKELHLLRRQQQQVFAAAGFPLQRALLPEEFEAGRWLEAAWSFRR